MVLQCTARTVLHGGSAGRRSHGGSSDDTMETAGGDGDAGDGAHRVAREPMKWRETEDLATLTLNLTLTK